jgi:hypothetical protein
MVIAVHFVLEIRCTTALAESDILYRHAFQDLLNQPVHPSMNPYIHLNQYRISVPGGNILTLHSCIWHNKFLR